MSILPVLTYPHPVLRNKCKPVAKLSKKVSRLIDDMTETMISFPGCVGISAPQVGKSLRIMIFDVSRHKKAPLSNHGLTKLINPAIVERNGKRETREGCLSLPEFTGNVVRSEKLKVKGKDTLGRRVEFYLEGFEAIAFQHELDHLDGILFIDRISSLKTNVFQRKIYK